MRRESFPQQHSEQESHESMSARDQQLVNDLVEIQAPVYVRSNTGPGYERVIIAGAVGDNVVVQPSNGEQEFRSKENLFSQHREGEVAEMKQLSIPGAVDIGGRYTEAEIVSFDAKHVRVNVDGGEMNIKIEDFLKTQAVANAEKITSEQTVQIWSKEDNQYYPGTVLKVNKSDGEVVTSYDRLNDRGEQEAVPGSDAAETLFA
tara:strand:- start:635 stop:1246 length:612 start_codon:yes stop_codon:yes gene_type:complete